MTVTKVPFFMGERLEGFEVPAPFVELDPSLPAGNPQERMGVLYRELATRVAGQEHPVVYAGDCVSTIGVLAGLQQGGVDATLVFFDAHGDFNTWETTPTGFLGGMPVAMLTGRGEQTIVEGAGLRVLPDEQVLHVGARDLDPEEAIALADSGIVAVGIEDVSTIDLPPGPLYVHIDVDVIDPVEVPATSYPAPGGPSVDDMLVALTRLARTERVVATSVSSWNPALPGADRAAAAVRRLTEPFR
ncbi:MAG: arginase [Acidimicrobiia bacterium]|nr:arginase [Acidimicrobiia bacterium]NNL97045.1 arginase [Acidimicrobiia bacterium]